MKRILLVLALALSVLTLGLTNSADAANQTEYPHKGEVVGYSDLSHMVGDHTHKRSSTFAVGDSILYRAYGYGFHRRHPGIEVSAVPGRDQGDLPYYIADRCANPSPLRTLIVALGTNATQGWTYADYRNSVNLLSKCHHVLKRVHRHHHRRWRQLPINVIFVTTWRDPVQFGRSTGLPYRSQAWPQSWNSKWMVQIASVRPHTCVAQWRSFAQRWDKPNYPTNKAAFDGVHFANPGVDPFGYNAYQALIEAKLRSCV